MDTMEHATSKKVRRHPAQLRQQVLAQCEEPGASVAKVALPHGLNANVVHGWRTQQRNLHSDRGQRSGVNACAVEGAEFIASLMRSQPAAAILPDIRIELRRGATTVAIAWPSQAARECAAWLKEWLR